ncbi:MAG TPA: peptidyl-alpha-hydroxyglycine alpha-amidating lyase family protein [Bryobacteraceae bacterium]|nr:peptidyl-alpha-hydroxyglycine alpha-amidating lyase family protein [Bryobacteraceae bacterium]
MTIRSSAWVAAALIFGELGMAQAPPAAGGLTRAQLNAKAKAEGAPEIPFESVPNFLKLPPNVFLGEGIGVATNSKGHVFVYTRGQATQLFEFDQTGKFVREIGEGLYGFVFAHAVRVDPQDNIWAVDEGANMIIKFNPEGRVAMVLGRRPEPVEGLPTPPDPSPYLFNRPTDVAWDAAGNIFVSDGYGNSRVVKYDRNGRFLKSVGSRGNQQGQLNLPHSIATDAHGNVYVGDRSNNRVQVFDDDLNFKAIYDKVGAPWAVCVSPGPHQYLFVSNSNPDSNSAEVAAVTGEIYKMELDGTIVGKFGHAGKKLGEFSTVHEIDCRNPDEPLVAEITAWRVQKLILHPIGAAGAARRQP